MAEKPLVSIGIPTFNRASSYLREALDCALAQTYEDVEVIVSDNCSSDHTSTLVRSRQDERIRYFRHEENIGANNNFNYCLQQARGRFFLLLHDDDLIDHDFVDSSIAAIPDDSEEIGLIRTGVREITGDGSTKSVKRNETQGMTGAELFLAWFGKKASFYLCSTLFNTERLKEIGGFSSPTGLFQDVVAIAELAARFTRVDVAEAKASFRRHDENKGSSASALAWATDSLFLLDRLCALMPERCDEFRRAGEPYLSRKSYRIASSIPSIVERFQTYSKVARRFEYGHSPQLYEMERLGKAGKALLASWIRGSSTEIAAAPANREG